MTAEFPVLADVIADTINDWHHAEKAAAAWLKACTITTVEQLEALKSDPLGCEGAVIKDADGDIYEAESDGTWTRTDSHSVPATWVELPALLLWHPGWGAK